MKKKMCVSLHLSAFRCVLVAFRCHFAFAALSVLVLQHPVLHQNATETPLKQYMKVNFTKNIDLNEIKSCLKFKIVCSLN